MDLSRASSEFTSAPPGFRLPTAARLGAVHLQVADLARSIAYYEHVLGLHVLERTPSGATMAADEGRSALLELTERPGANPVPRRGRLGLYHFALLLPDRAALGRFLAHLRTLGEYAGMADHLVSEAVYLTDPDGLGIEVYADRPRETWKVDERTLAMASDPLDVDDLLRVAGGERWTGAPAGTSNGHVHLYVNDLGAAEAFYHRGLGFDRVNLAFPGALFMSAGGYHHHLGTNTWAAGAPRAGEDDARLLEWRIVVPASADVDAAASSLAGAGIPIARDGGDLLVVDPWGTRVRIGEEPELAGR